VRKVDARILMFLGFMMAAWGMWDARIVTDQWGFWEFAGVQAMRGAGVMIAMIASQQVTMATLPPHMVKNASGLVNLSRNVGGAFGLAILNTSLTQNTALHMAELTSAIDQTHQGVRDMMAGMAVRFAGSIDPQASAMKAVYGLLQKQATTLAFGDAFALLAIGCACAGFLTLLSKPAKPNPSAAPSDAH
jgi:DHA2 family multidrug resistance protein